eukprot:5445069-Prymnesium_polylepis.1
MGIFLSGLVLTLLSPGDFGGFAGGVTEMSRCVPPQKPDGRNFLLRSKQPLEIAVNRCVSRGAD